ncbi:TetR/AcrR family transcriptional regulator [Nocardia sp. NPDC052566]|uniref:TetR/AcrR family transcriptional regulator n=1 Tax=Nocardia sp. NPDC052566 TaxID=3364330 RepID=UPI0037C8A232
MASSKRARSDATPRPRLPDARRRMIEGTIDSLRVHGASATSVDRVLASTGAPRGSVYHHFPGGRTQMITDAVTIAGELMTQFIEQLTREGDSAGALEQFGALWRRTLTDSDFRAGCPIFAVAVETNDDTPEFAASAAAIFERWHLLMTGMLVREGIAEERAQRLATLTVASIEGAVALCRVQRSTSPLDDTLSELRILLDAAR